MRKIILNLAISLDGYIASPNGEYDWIAGDENSISDNKTFDFSNFVSSVDTIIMGSKAYQHTGIEHIEDYKNKKIIVLTSNHKLKNEFVEFFKGNIVEKVSELKNEKGKDIWLYGGSSLTDYFIKEDLIDEYIIGIIPVILGKGIPLFLENNPKIELRLKSQATDDGILILTYTKRK